MKYQNIYLKISFLQEKKIPQINTVRHFKNLIQLGYNQINTLSTTLTQKIYTSMDIIQKSMVQGILESGIREDGGPQCYAQIPRLYHIMFGLFFALLHVLIIKYWGHYLIDKNQQRHPDENPTLFEKFIAFNGIICLILTFYFKIVTGKGLFIFNPCHMSLMMQIILLFSRTSSLTRKIHTSWTSWLFGALMALVFPHLQGITEFEVYLYYYQHLLIFPIGPFILYKRYGFVCPGFKNQLASFSSMVLYQLSVLQYLSILTQVNLNFVLCHSPADPFFKYIGYHYFSAAVIVLNIFSFICRYLSFVMISPFKFYYIAKYKKQDDIEALKNKAKNVKRQ